MHRRQSTFFSISSQAKVLPTLIQKKRKKNANNQKRNEGTIIERRLIKLFDLNYNFKFSFYPQFREIKF